MSDAPRPVRVIVVANEKGGSGKSTIAMHIAVALMTRGKSVATVDLDTRQRTFTHYVENRRGFATRTGREIEIPRHICLEPAQDDDMAALALVDVLDTLAQAHDTIVIDTPGHDGALMRRAHMLADTLITPVNDSFVDLDVLAGLDPDTLTMIEPSQYAKTVENARIQRVTSGQAAIDWVVLRNRMSMTPSHNKRQVAAGLQELSQKLGFRCTEGLAERVVYREFFLRGLTALDDLDEVTLGKRPTMSHITAREEVETLLNGLNLGGLAGVVPSDEANRDAA